MERNLLIPMDFPAIYRICVIGKLESSWSERLWGITSTPIEETGKPQQTMLVGKVVDQAALIGIFNALYNTGHTVVSVERLLPDSDTTDGKRTATKASGA